MSPDPLTGFSIVNWLSGIFAQKRWYRFTAVLGTVILILSLFFPTVYVSNNTVQWVTALVIVLSVVEWAQLISYYDRRRNDYYLERSDDPGFLLAKVLLSVAFTHPIWSPWVDLIDRDPFSSYLGLFALVVFILVALSIGAVVNWTIIISLEDSEGLQAIWGVFSFLAFLVMCALAVNHLIDVGLSFIALIVASCTLGLFMTPVIFASWLLLE